VKRHVKFISMGIISLSHQFSHQRDIDLYYVSHDGMSNNMESIKHVVISDTWQCINSGTKVPFVHDNGRNAVLQTQVKHDVLGKTCTVSGTKRCVLPTSLACGQKENKRISKSPAIHVKIFMMVAIQYNSIRLINTQYRCDYTRAHAGHVML
jgi:hypothetical protein